MVSNKSMINKGEVQAPLLHQQFSSSNMMIEDIGKILKMSIPRSFEMLLYIWAPFLIVSLFAGRLSVDTLSVSILGSSIYRGTIRIMFRGLGLTGATLYGQAYGAGNYKSLGIIFQRNLIIGIILIFLTAILYIPMEQILTALGQENFAASTATYLQILIPFSFFDAVFWFSSIYFQAQKIPFVAMISAFIGLVTQVFFLWLFTYHYTYDVIGLSIGYGSSGSVSGFCMMLIIFWWHNKMKGDVKNPWYGFTTEAFKELGPMFLLMIFGATSQAFKSWGCEYLTILSGLLDNPSLYVGSFGIYFNICLFGFTVIYGIAVSGGVLIATEIGKGDVKAAKLIVYVVATVEAIFSISLSILIIIFREYIGSWWTDDKDVQAEVSKLSYFVCLTIIGNAITSVGLSVLIGVRKQRSIFLLTILVVITVGATVPPLLCFGFGMDFYGLVIGYVIADASEAIAYIIVAYRVNWDKEVQNAKEKNALKEYDDISNVTIE